MQEEIIQYQKDTITESGTVKVSELSSQTGGDAEAGDILKGKTAWVNGVKVIGTIENKGTVNKTLNAGNLYKIGPGYYSGGTIQAKDLESQTSGTAKTTDIVNGKIAWVNGKKLVGTLVNSGGLIYSQLFEDKTITYKMPNDREKIIAVICGFTGNGGYNNLEHFKINRISGECTVEFLSDTYFGYTNHEKGWGSYSVVCEITAKEGTSITFENPQSGGAVYIF